MTETQKTIPSPIVARRLLSEGVAEPQLYRVIRLDSHTMVLEEGETFFPSGVEMEFEVLIFGALAIHVRARCSEKKRDKKDERTLHFTNLDQAGQELLEETFLRFSHLKYKDLETITSKPGGRVRKRVPTKIPATLLVGEALISGQIENLSEAGAFFACDRLLPLSAEGVLRFSPEGDKTPLTMQTRVVWHWEEIKHGLRSFSAGAGLQFIGGSAESIKGVAEFVKLQKAKDKEKKAESSPD